MKYILYIIFMIVIIFNINESKSQTDEQKHFNKSFADRLVKEGYNSCITSDDPSMSIFDSDSEAKEGYCRCVSELISNAVSRFYIDEESYEKFKNVDRNEWPNVWKQKMDLFSDGMKLAKRSCLEYERIQSYWKQRNKENKDGIRVR